MFELVDYKANWLGFEGTVHISALLVGTNREGKMQAVSWKT